MEMGLMLVLIQIIMMVVVVVVQMMMMDGGVSDHTNGDQARWRREPVHLLFHQQGRQP